MDFRPRKPKQPSSRKLVSIYVDRETHSEMLRYRQRLALSLSTSVTGAAAARHCLLKGLGDAMANATISHAHDRDETPESLLRLIYAWHMHLLPREDRLYVAIDGHRMTRYIRGQDVSPYYAIEVMDSLGGFTADELTPIIGALDALAEKYDCGKASPPNTSLGLAELRMLWSLAEDIGMACVTDNELQVLNDPIGRYNAMTFMEKKSAVGAS